MLDRGEYTECMREKSMVFDELMSDMSDSLFISDQHSPRLYQVVLEMSYLTHCEPPQTSLSHSLGVCTSNSDTDQKRPLRSFILLSESLLTHQI